MLCYLIGTLLGFFLLVVMPCTRFPFTKAGADSKPTYLMHAPFVLLLQEMKLPGTCCALLTAAFLFVVSKFMQWVGKPYGIIGGRQNVKHF